MLGKSSNTVLHRSVQADCSAPLPPPWACSVLITFEILLRAGRARGERDQDVGYQPLLVEYRLN